MLNKIKQLLKYIFFVIRKVIFIFFIIFAVIFTITYFFDKDLGFYLPILFLFLGFIIYPEFLLKNKTKNVIKLNFITDDIFYFINKLLNKKFNKEYKLLFNKLLNKEFNSFNSDIEKIINKYNISKDYIIFIFLNDIINFIKNKNLLTKNEKEITIFLANSLNNKKLYKNKIIKLLREYYNFIISDYKITDIEKKLLEKFLNIFSIDLVSIGFDQNDFNKYYAIYLLEDKSELPNLKISGDLPIILKKDEKIYWMEKAFIYKKKIKTIKSDYYIGGSSSIKIARGIRFSVGNYKRPSYKQEFTYLEDQGFFIVTNQRVGFIGKEQNFFIKYDQIINFQLIDEGLFIMKENRQKPYIITLNNYEVVLILLSKILNNEI